MSAEADRGGTLPEIVRPPAHSPITLRYAEREVVIHSLSDADLDAILTVSPTNFGMFTFCGGAAIGAARALASTLTTKSPKPVMVALPWPTTVALGVLTILLRCPLR